MLSRLRIFALAVAGCLVRPAFGDNAIATGSNHRQQHYSVDAVQACAVQSFVNGSCSEGDNSEEPGPQFRNSSFSPSTVSFARNISSASWTPPLSTRGRYIVDADGQRFKLRGGNWHGASGTYTGSGNIDDPSNHHAGELAYQTPLALDRVPISKIIDSFLELGINTIRLPFSNQMIHDTTSVPDAGIMANPQFHGMTPLQVFDAVIKALTDANIAVILNNMTIKSIWCCGFDQNARWNEVQTTAQWQADWLFMVNRYKSNQRVVGADLYNEVRRDLLFDPVWGMTSWSQSSQDWYQASLEMGNRILREVNPDILIVIEGESSAQLVRFSRLTTIGSLCSQASTGSVFPSTTQPTADPTCSPLRTSHTRLRTPTSWFIRLTFMPTPAPRTLGPPLALSKRAILGIVICGPTLSRLRSKLRLPMLRRR